MSNQASKMEKRQAPVPPDEKKPEKPTPMLRGTAMHEASTDEKTKTSTFATLKIPEKLTEKEKDKLTMMIEGYLHAPKETTNKGSQQDRSLETHAQHMEKKHLPDYLPGFEYLWDETQQAEKETMAKIFRLLPEAPYTPSTLRHINENFFEWTKYQQEHRSEVICFDNKVLIETPNANYFQWRPELDPKRRTQKLMNYDLNITMTYAQLDMLTYHMQEGRLGFIHFLGPQTEAPYLLHNSNIDKLHKSHCCRMKDKDNIDILHVMNCSNISRELENCTHHAAENQYITSTWFNQSLENIPKIIFLSYAVFNKIQDRAEKGIKHPPLIEELPCTMEEFQFMCLNNPRTMKNILECDELRILLQNAHKPQTEDQTKRRLILTQNRVVSHPTNKEAQFHLRPTDNAPQRSIAIIKKQELTDRLRGDHNEDDWEICKEQRKALNQAHKMGRLPYWCYCIKTTPYQLTNIVKMHDNHNQKCALRGPNCCTHYINTCAFVNANIPKTRDDKYNQREIEPTFFRQIRSDKEVMTIFKLRAIVFFHLGNWMENPRIDRTFAEMTNLTRLEWDILSMHDKDFEKSVNEAASMAAEWFYQTGPDTTSQDTRPEETFHTSIPRDSATVEQHPLPNAYHRLPERTLPPRFMQGLDTTGTRESNLREDPPPTYMAAVKKQNIENRTRKLKAMAKFTLQMLSAALIMWLGQ
jgi:hypothetical protein